MLFDFAGDVSRRFRNRRFRRPIASVHFCSAKSDLVARKRKDMLSEGRFAATIGFARREVENVRGRAADCSEHIRLRHSLSFTSHCSKIEDVSETLKDRDEKYTTHVCQNIRKLSFHPATLLIFLLLIVSIARNPSTSFNHVRKRRHNLRCVPLRRSLSRTIATTIEGTSSLASSTRRTWRNFARSIAIQHSSVDVLEICVLAPLEKLLLQVSTARAVSGTWTNCTFSLGHLFLP